MMIAPRVSLVRVMINGVTAIMNREEAKEVKRNHADVKITPLHKRAEKKGSVISPVRVIDPQSYMKGEIRYVS